jgi:hypothetical protein
LQLKWEKNNVRSGLLKSDASLRHEKMHYMTNHECFWIIP